MGGIEGGFVWTGEGGFVLAEGGLLLLGWPTHVPYLYLGYFLIHSFVIVPSNYPRLNYCYLHFHITLPRQYPHVFLRIYPSFLFLSGPPRF